MRLCVSVCACARVHFQHVRKSAEAPGVTKAPIAASPPAKEAKVPGEAAAPHAASPPAKKAKVSGEMADGSLSATVTPEARKRQRTV